MEIQWSAEISAVKMQSCVSLETVWIDSGSDFTKSDGTEEEQLSTITWLLQQNVLGIFFFVRILFFFWGLMNISHLSVDLF